MPATQTYSPATQTYSPEEIRMWKELIYGSNIGYEVDEWVSSDQRTFRKKSSLSSRRPKSSSRTNAPSSTQDEWLSSPKSPVRSYRIKGEASDTKPWLKWWAR